MAEVVGEDEAADPEPIGDRRRRRQRPDRPEPPRNVVRDQEGRVPESLRLPRERYSRVVRFGAPALHPEPERSPMTHHPFR